MIGIFMFITSIGTVITAMQILEPRRWLEHLGDPRSTLVLSGAGYSDHRHRPVPLENRRLDSHLLWFTVDHGFAGHVDGQRVELAPGTLSWFVPGTRHDFVIPQGLRTDRVRIDLRWRGRGLSLPAPVMVASGAWHLRAPFEQLMLELAQPQPYGEQRQRQLVGALAVGTFRAQDEAHGGRVLDLAQRLALQAYVAEHISATITPADLARQVGLSPDYFSRLFKRSFGLAPRAWLVQERLRQAATLLVETSLNVGEIARDCGYRDLNLFSRLFRQHYGCSPRAFRRR